MTACVGADPLDRSTTAEATVTPRASIPTLTPLPMLSQGPPSGEVVADLRQSSRDVALERFQVWVGNGLTEDLDPTSITFQHSSLGAPIHADRLRVDPSGSERGYPLALPRRPDCSAAPGQGRLTIRTAGRRVTVPVDDEAAVVQRYVAARCFTLAVAEVAVLSWDDVVRSDDTVGATGTPLLTGSPPEAWEPRKRIGPGGAAQVDLPMIPARCDAHVFMESGGATTFRLRLKVQGRLGELLLPMSPAGARSALNFARSSCGL